MRRNNAIALASRISDKAHKLIIRELADNGVYGIVPSHGGILAILFSEQKQTMKELAEKIFRTKPTVTVLVDKLVELGYVRKERCCEDNRVTYIALTEKGIALQPVFAKISDRLNAVVYQGFYEEEAERLEALLARINANLDDCGNLE